MTDSDLKTAAEGSALPVSGTAGWSRLSVLVAAALGVMLLLGAVDVLPWSGTLKVVPGFIAVAVALLLLDKEPTPRTRMAVALMIFGALCSGGITIRDDVRAAVSGQRQAEERRALETILSHDLGDEGIADLRPADQVLARGLATAKAVQGIWDEYEPLAEDAVQSIQEMGIFLTSAPQDATVETDDTTIFRESLLPAEALLRVLEERFDAVGFRLSERAGELLAEAQDAVAGLEEGASVLDAVDVHSVISVKVRALTRQVDREVRQVQEESRRRREDLIRERLESQEK